jgi:hypothetical protein
MRRFSSTGVSLREWLSRVGDHGAKGQRSSDSSNTKLSNRRSPSAKHDCIALVFLRRLSHRSGGIEPTPIKQRRHWAWDAPFGRH